MSILLGRLEEHAQVAILAARYTLEALVEYGLG
jgi:hypothetical protein